MAVDVQFAALADATRCRVIELLHERPRPVHELAAAFSISRPAISRHLRVLKEAGLVQEQKRGREHLYSLKRGRLRSPSEWLLRHLGKAEAAGAPPQRRKKAVTKVEPSRAASAAAPQMQLDLF